MALVTCPECNQSLSDTAQSCPHCGFVQKTQIQPVVVEANPARPVVIERTSKIWKILILFSLAFSVVGAAYIGGGKNKEIGLINITLGISLFIVSRIGAWWNNK